MKKFISTLLFLVGIVGTTFATDYDLYVAGTRVTSSNAKKVMTGVSYDASNKVLTLDNATIETSKDDTPGIWNSGIDGLTIKVIGKATVKSTNSHGIVTANSTTIMSDNYGSLNVYGSDNKDGMCAIWMKNGNSLTISKIWVYARAGYYGVCGTNKTPNETLNLKECCIYANLTNSAATNSVISGWKEIKLWGVTYDYNGNKFDSSTHKMTDSSGKNLKSCWVYGRLMVGRHVIDPRYDRTLTMANSEAGITTGTVKWVASSKELQLENAIMTPTSSFSGITFYGYSGSSDPLNIWVSGTSIIKTAQGGRPINIYKDKLSIDGQSRTAAILGLGCEDVAGIYCGGSSLSIGTIGLTIRSGNNCITGASGAELTIGTSSGGSTIDITSTNGDAIYGFKSCTLTNDATSNGTYFNSSKKGFTEIGGTMAKTVKMDQPTASYDCRIFGNDVNNVNCNNFACEGVESGTIKWDNSTKTLSLNNVKLNNTSVTNQAAIRPGSNSGSTVTMNISGSNSIIGGHSSIYPGGNLIIKGTGNLNCENTGSFGAILAGGGNTTITIEVDGKMYFKGKNGYTSNVSSSANNKLVLKNAGSNSDYTFEGTTAAMANLYGGLTLNEMDFYSNTTNGGSPGCYFDAEDHRAEQNGGTTAKKVNFFKPSKKYNINVGGTRVTNCNASGIGSKYISSGTTSVTYNSSSDKLILNNAKISVPENTKTHAIYTYSDTYCTVELIGKNELSNNNSNYTDIYFDNGGTITGGELVTKGTSRSDLYAVEGEMTIKNSKITCAHSIWGEKKTATLTIDNSTVEANYYIGGFGNLYTANTYLIEPKNGKYDSSASTPYVVDAKGTRAAHVLYGPQELLGIVGLEADDSTGEAEVKHIYDLNGSEQGELKRGVNIIRMSDGTVRKVIRK